MYVYSYVFSEAPQSSKGVRNGCAARKPAVPARTDIPPMGLHTKRDFTKTTTVVPMKPQPTCVDAKTGHKQRLENSGLVPKYIKKKVSFPNENYPHRKHIHKFSHKHHGKCIPGKNLLSSICRILEKYPITSSSAAKRSSELRNSTTTTWRSKRSGEP